MHWTVLLDPCTEAIALSSVCALQHDEVPTEFNAALLRFLPGAMGVPISQGEASGNSVLLSTTAGAE